VSVNRTVWLLATWACAGTETTRPAIDPVDLPGHSDCLPDGEEMSAEVCLAVVEADGRSPNVSSDQSDAPPPVPETRLDDPEYQWLTAEVKRCTCSCCHTMAYGGPGVHRWDLDFEPVWIDSMDDWAVNVFVGEAWSENQYLPTDDPERLQAVIGTELARREAARE
jgi:hypothetical protein